MRRGAGGQSTRTKVQCDGCKLQSFKTMPFIKSFSLFAVGKKNDYISLGCICTDTFYCHGGQVGWKIDIKEEICASIAKSTSLHVSCRTYSVSSSLLLC